VFVLPGLFVPNLLQRVGEHPYPLLRISGVRRLANNLFQRGCQDDHARDGVMGVRSMEGLVNDAGFVMILGIGIAENDDGFFLKSEDGVGGGGVRTFPHWFGVGRQIFRLRGDPCDWFSLCGGALFGVVELGHAKDCRWTWRGFGFGREARRNRKNWKPSRN